MVAFLDRLENNAGSMILGIAMTLAFAVIGIQAVSYVISQIWDVKQLTLGPLLALITLVSVIAVGVMAALNPQQFSTGAWVAVGVLVASVIFMYFIFPTVAPEFARPAMSSLKIQTMSLLGI